MPAIFNTRQEMKFTPLFTKLPRPLSGRRRRGFERGAASSRRGRTAGYLAAQPSAGIDGAICPLRLSNYRYAAPFPADDAVTDRGRRRVLGAGLIVGK